MPIADHQALTIFIASLLVELDIVEYLIVDRGLQQLPGSFLQ
jgi:hypothetical protein